MRQIIGLKIQCEHFFAFEQKRNTYFQFGVFVLVSSKLSRPKFSPTKNFECILNWIFSQFSGETQNANKQKRFIAAIGENMKSLIEL